MITFILAIVLATGPSHANTATKCDGGTGVFTNTGGDTEHLPTDPPPHPHSIPWQW